MLQKAIIFLTVVFIWIFECFSSSPITLEQAQSHLKIFPGGENVIEKIDPIIEQMSDNNLEILGKNAYKIIDNYEPETFYRIIFEYIIIKTRYELYPHLYQVINVDIKEREVIQWDNISVHYTWYLDDGTQFDSSHDRWITLDFIAGRGQMIVGFDTAVIWMILGEKKTVIIAPSDWYGEYDLEWTQYISKLELQSFTDAWYTLEVWEILPTQYWEFTITQSDALAVTIDTNHFLAGKTLTFDIELIKIYD
jgi:peptidylprolyl isomerase